MIRQYKVPTSDPRVIPLCLLHWRSKDVSGEKYSRLTAVGVVHKKYVSSKTRGNFWLFKCTCGGEVIVRLTDVFTGKQSSCGCRRREVTRDRMQTHGKSQTDAYKTWSCMIRRCYDPRHPDYKNYAERDILICDHWYNPLQLEQSFLNFYNDMGDRPFKSSQIDRIDNDKGYFPENCRWSTPKQNSNNTRRTVFVTLNGVTRSVSEWADITGMPIQRIRCRANLGWAAEDVLNTNEGHRPIRKQ